MYYGITLFQSVLQFVCSKISFQKGHKLTQFISRSNAGLCSVGKNLKMPLYSSLATEVPSMDSNTYETRDTDTEQNSPREANTEKIYNFGHFI